MSENQPVMDFKTALITAQRAIDAAQTLVDLSLSGLKKACTQEGRVSTQMLDDYQWVGYELARFAAEITGARHMLAYAEIARSGATSDQAVLEERSWRRSRARKSPM